MLPNINTVRCVKGSRYHGFVKNRVYPVVSANVLEDYSVKLVIQTSGRQIVVYARHPNRLAGEFNVHSGDPTKTARFVVG